MSETRSCPLCASLIDGNICEMCDINLDIWNLPVSMLNDAAADNRESSRQETPAHSGEARESMTEYALRAETSHGLRQPETGGDSRGGQTNLGGGEVSGVRAEKSELSDNRSPSAHLDEIVERAQKKCLGEMRPTFVTKAIRRACEQHAEGVRKFWQDTYNTCLATLEETRRQLDEAPPLTQLNLKLRRKLEQAEAKYADTEADGVVFCGKCGKQK